MYSSKVQTRLGLSFVPLSGQSSSGDWLFGEHSRCNLWPPPSLPLGFLGVQQAHLLRRMLTIQNFKKSWLAMKPACSLVDNASLGPRLTSTCSGCLCLPITGGGWAGLQLACSAQSFVLSGPEGVFSSVSESCLTLCNPMNRSMPGFPVHQQLPEFTQTHVHRVSDAIQPSHPLSSPSPPAPNPSQNQSFPMSQLFA